MEEVMTVSGKRKTSVAKSSIRKGSGKVTLNKRPLGLLPYLKYLEVSEPLILAKEILGDLKFDIDVNVTGGGTSSRVEAARLSIARAIVQFTGNETLRGTYLAYDRNLLVADTRRKEACKPGDSKARAMRQTSFR